MLVILSFILILNIVSIVLMYYCLGDLEKKEKLIFIAAGTAIMYILTTIVYWISTNNIEISEVSETGKNLITFLFVPINGLLILPIFAKSYYSNKMGTLNSNILKKRGIFLGVILLILLVIECIYFKNIQVQVVNLLKEQEANSTQEQQYFTNSTIILVESNEVNVENQIDVNTTNDVANETIY